jgi:hypothetical protein
MSPRSARRPPTRREEEKKHRLHLNIGKGVLGTGAAATLILFSQFVEIRNKWIAGNAAYISVAGVLQAKVDSLRLVVGEKQVVERKLKQCAARPRRHRQVEVDEPPPPPPKKKSPTMAVLSFIGGGFAALGRLFSGG